MAEERPSVLTDVEEKFYVRSFDEDSEIFIDEHVAKKRKIAEKSDAKVTVGGISYRLVDHPNENFFEAGPLSQIASQVLVRFPQPQVFGQVPLPQVFGQVPRPHVFGAGPQPQAFGTGPQPQALGAGLFPTVSHLHPHVPEDSKVVGEKLKLKDDETVELSEGESLEIEALRSLRGWTDEELQKCKFRGRKFISYEYKRKRKRRIRGCFHSWLEMHRTAVNLKSFLPLEDTIGDMTTCQC